MTNPSAAGAAPAAASTNAGRAPSLPGFYEGLEEPAASVLDRSAGDAPDCLQVHNRLRPLW